MTFAAGVRVLDRWVTRTQLGMRLWDAQLDRPVSAGVSAVAYDEAGRHGPVRAVRGPSGILSFHGLPGMRDLEYPAADDATTSSSSSGKMFVVSAVDLERRFLPMVFRVRLPIAGGLVGGGVFRPPPTSPPAGNGGGAACLYSAPTRPAPGHVATVRAHLWDLTSDRGAGHAVVLLSIGTRTTTGVADEAGNVLIIMPYPPVDLLSVTPPPGSVDEQTWPVHVRVQYSPDRLTYPLAARLGSESELGRTPNLKTVLQDQRDATIYPAEPSATPTGGVPVLERNLEYGRTLVLKSSPADPTKDTSRLFIQPN